MENSLVILRVSNNKLNKTVFGLAKTDDVAILKIYRACFLSEAMIHEFYNSKIVIDSEVMKNDSDNFKITMRPLKQIDIDVLNM